jgi:predicted DNA-binding transcriptional regulator AlpA
MTAVEAAEVLGITRQSVTRMMAEGTFRTQRAIGDRPLFVVRVEEVRRYKELRAKATSWRQAAERLTAQTDQRIGLDKV